MTDIRIQNQVLNGPIECQYYILYKILYKIDLRSETGGIVWKWFVHRWTDGQTEGQADGENPLYLAKLCIYNNL